MKNLKTKWGIVSIILFLILIISIFTNGFGIKAKMSSNSSTKVGEMASDFVNNSLIQNSSTASLLEANCRIKEEFCKVSFDLSGKTIESYISSDGTIFLPDVIDIEEYKNQSQTSNVPSGLENVEKVEKPEVNLFIMTYCPFGLQAQKAMLPVMELLGDKADIKINFVDYAMHDKEELDENLLQYCLQNQDYDQFINYSKCFVVSGETQECLTSANVDQNMLNSCISETDDEYKVTEKYNDKDTWINGSYPSFPIEKDLNQEYGVQGSPTFILNEVKVTPSRTPEDYKNIICEGFKDAPQECEEKLSSSVPEASFGGGEADASNNASCN